MNSLNKSNIEIWFAKTPTSSAMDFPGRDYKLLELEEADSIILQRDRVVQHYQGSDLKVLLIVINLDWDNIKH